MLDPGDGFRVYSPVHPPAFNPLAANAPQHHRPCPPPLQQGARLTQLNNPAVLAMYPDPYSRRAITQGMNQSVPLLPPPYSRHHGLNPEYNPRL